MDGYDVYEAGKEDVVGSKLHGGNFPHSSAGPDEFGPEGGGSVVNGLSMKSSFMDYDPEDCGMGTAGPNQLPIGPARESAGRGHRFG